MTKALIDQLLVPLIASNISLLFALMSRNAMVSQRIREACRELASDSCLRERGLCLTKQIAAFDARYASNKWAIVSVLVSVSSFMLAVIFSASGILELFGAVSLVSFLMAVFLTLRDFVRATETLIMEIEYSRDRYERKLINTQSESSNSGIARQAGQ